MKSTTGPKELFTILLFLLTISIFIGLIVSISGGVGNLIEMFENIFGSKVSNYDKIAIYNYNVLACAIDSVAHGKELDCVEEFKQPMSITSAITGFFAKITGKATEDLEDLTEKYNVEKIPNGATINCKKTNIAREEIIENIIEFIVPKGARVDGELLYSKYKDIIGGIGRPEEFKELAEAVCEARCNEIGKEVCKSSEIVESTFHILSYKKEFKVCECISKDVTIAHAVAFNEWKAKKICEAFGKKNGYIFDVTLGKCEDGVIGGYRSEQTVDYGTIYRYNCKLTISDLECKVDNFRLKQDITKENAEKWIKGFGHPAYLVYWETFPVKVQRSWSSFSSIWENVVDVVFAWIWVGQVMKIGKTVIFFVAKREIADIATKPGILGKVLIRVIGEKTVENIIWSPPLINEIVNSALAVGKKELMVWAGVRTVQIGAKIGEEIAYKYIQSVVYLNNIYDNSLVLKIPYQDPKPVKISYEKPIVFNGRDMENFYLVSPCYANLTIKKGNVLCGNYSYLLQLNKSLCSQASKGGKGEDITFCSTDLNQIFYGDDVPYKLKKLIDEGDKANLVIVKWTGGYIRGSITIIDPIDKVEFTFEQKEGIKELKNVKIGDKEDKEFKEFSVDNGKIDDKCFKVTFSEYKCGEELVMEGNKIENQKSVETCKISVKKFEEEKGASDCNYLSMVRNYFENIKEIKYELVAQAHEIIESEKEDEKVGDSLLNCKPDSESCEIKGTPTSRTFLTSKLMVLYNESGENDEGYVVSYIDMGRKSVDTKENILDFILPDGSADVISIDRYGKKRILFIETGLKFNKVPKFTAIDENFDGKFDMINVRDCIVDKAIVIDLNKNKPEGNYNFCMPSQNLLTKIRPVISYAPEIFTAIGAGIGAVVGAFGGGVGAAPGAVTGSKVGSFVGAGILTAYNIYTRVKGTPDIWPGEKW